MTPHPKYTVSRHNRASRLYLGIDLDQTKKKLKGGGVLAKREGAVQLALMSSERIPAVPVSLTSCESLPALNPAKGPWVLRVFAVEIAGRFPSSQVSILTTKL